MIHPVHGSIPPVPAALIAAVLLLSISSFAAGQKNAPVAEVSGELKQWHKVTLTLAGPSAGETDRDPNPFLDYLLTVTFRHQSGSPVYRVPGYFAAGGNAANSSATAGNKWKAHLSPDKTGRWDYRPRQGGKLLPGSIRSITGGGPAAIGQPPAEPDQDWLAILRKN